MDDFFKRGCDEHDDFLNSENPPKKARTSAPKKTPFPPKVFPAKAVPAKAVPEKAVVARAVPEKAVPARAIPKEVETTLQLSTWDEDDVDVNPYPDAPTAKWDPATDAKVVFISLRDGEKVHEYVTRGGFSDLLISASRLQKFWMGMLRPDKGTQGSKIERVTAEITKDFSIGNETHIGKAHQVFSDYLNDLGGGKLAPLPLSYAARRGFLLTKCSCDFSGFVHSDVFVRLEEYYATGCCAEKPLEGVKDAEKFVNWVYSDKHALDHISHEGLRAALTGFTRVPPTLKDIQKGFKGAGEAGTAYHAYLEARLNIGGSSFDFEELQGRLPCRDPLDYIHAERFVKLAEELKSVGEFVALEHVMVSNKHKIVGTADAIFRFHDGTEQLWDHKRITAFNNEEWFINRTRNTDGEPDRAGVPMDKLSPSKKAFEYALNETVYRKLRILNGHKKQASTAILDVDHPSFDNLVLVELNLAAKLAPDIPAKFGFESSGRLLSMIELVELIFQARLLMLESHYSK